VKVLYLSPTGTLGGAEKVLLSVMKGVRETQPDASLHLLSLSDGPLLRLAAALGVHVATLPLPASLESLGDSQLTGTKGRASAAISVLSQMLTGSADAWRFLGNLRRAIRRVGPDLIHSNGIKTHCLVTLAHDGKAPVVWHVHDFLSARPLACRLLRLASRRMAAAIAISPAVSADLEILGLARRTRVIVNAVDVNEYHPGMQDGALLDELSGLPAAPAGCLRVGLIATYARWKGHDVFLEAAARLANSCPERPVRFYVVGGPIYQTRGSQFDQAELREMGRRLGIANRVGFIDFQANIAPIYRALDVVVHASTSPEPFGLTIIEAMACGKPVVASLAGGVADIIQTPYDAIGIPGGNVGELAGALNMLMDDGQLRAQLGARARCKVCERFAQERLGPQIVELYFDLTHFPQISSSRVQKVFMHP
jgi:glycosyltransferase involved in cell wall biosynthesis